ncbi:hypothetical protein ACIBCO_32010 [Streptomyces violascens]|uniref:hypothetical protein n=1 Tax=Streptomyces violascens TaxID=67381 RepID=UPI0037B8FBA4
MTVALSMTGLGMQSASAAEAAVPVPHLKSYSVDATSNIRTSPRLRKDNIVYTMARRGSMDIDCWTRGDDANSGGHHTNVWYEGSVWTGSRYLDDVYVWGGNVGTPHDPPSGLPHC